MTFSNQIIISTATVIIMVTIIVATILISINLFRIAHSLKIRNQLLKQVSRPYLYCYRNNNQLEIINDSNIPIQVSSISSNIDLPDLKNKLIPAHKSLYYRLNTSDNIKMTVYYHDQISDYQDQFVL